jgi:glycogen synthase
MCNNIRRVLMTADTVGGVWTYSIELARTLARRGIEIALATMGAPLSPDQHKQAAAIPNLKVYESSFRLEWMDDPWTDIARAGDWLLTLENEFAPDIVHVNDYAHGDLPWHAPHVVVGHSCVLSWWRAVRGQDAPAEWSRYRETVTRGLRAAEYVIAPSRTMISNLQRYYGPLRATAVIPNARDPFAYRMATKERFILAAGRVWDEAKNLACLGDLTSRVEWPVCVAGEAQHPDGGARPIQDVRLLGVLPAEDLAGWYSRASIYCLPARYEPFGLSVLEAALSGCALVLGDIPSLRENWEGAAVFVDPEDRNALAAEVNELIGNAARRHALAAHAYARGLSFTPDRMGDAYMGVYRELVSTHVPAASAQK